MKPTSDRIIYPHVYGAADREVGGILVGRVTSPGSLPRITGAIAAVDADERRATLTFTQDTWEHVHRVMERDHPDDAIVGWYHSHPSFGIFLSEHDLFIHRNFFGGPSQVALVVDPVHHEEGLFVWQDGAIVPLYDRPVPGKEALVPTKPARPARGEPRRDGGRYPPMLLLLGVLVGVLLGLGGWTLAIGPSDPQVRPAASTLPAAGARTPADDADACEEQHVQPDSPGGANYSEPCDPTPTTTDATQTRTKP